MRLFTKYFLFGMLVLGLAFSVSGYFLLHYSMESSLAREAEFALRQFQYDKFTVQSAMLSGPDVYDVKSLFAGLAEEISSPVAFFAEDGTVVYTEIEGIEDSFLEELSEGAHVYRFQDTPEGGCVLVGSVLNGDDITLREVIWNVTEDYQGVFSIVPKDGAEWPGSREGTGKFSFVTRWDVSKAIRQQQTLRQYFVRCYLVAMAAGMVLLGVLSALLTTPLKRMSKAAGRMAEGCYEERLAISGRDEIGELAGSFNRMADAVEEKIGELVKTAVETTEVIEIR